LLDTERVLPFGQILTFSSSSLASLHPHAAEEKGNEDCDFREAAIYDDPPSSAFAFLMPAGAQSGAEVGRPVVNPGPEVGRPVVNPGPEVGRPVVNPGPEVGRPAGAQSGAEVSRPAPDGADFRLPPAASAGSHREHPHLTKASKSGRLTWK
jgi:hypothetical protein